MDRFEEAKAKIKDTLDLVTLVESYLPLKRAGRNMVGLCPFHAEKSPSFNVSAATQHYKCFGCGKAGDVFSFVMEREGLDFRTAFELLAERAGVPLDGVFQGGRSDGRSQRTLVAQTLATVASYFQACLQSAAGDAARAYVERRGLTAAVDSFGLGFHPVGGELLRFARARKLPLEVLQGVGLLGRDGRREMFAGRVMFPIADEGGRIVGFGGRVLAKEEPKYLNSPESPFFNKRRLLFGLRQVKELGVRKLLVVEGYTDVIACHLAGFTGAVATLGTSLTADHARLLLRYATEGVVLLFDGDRAGRQAAERALRELCNVELPVHIAFMDEGVDPADLVHVAPGASPEQIAAGRARMAAILAAAEDPMVAWFKLLRGRYDFRDEVGMSKAAQECAALLSAVESPVRRETMLRRMAPWFGGDESGLRRLLKPAAGQAAATPDKPEASEPQAQRGPRSGPKKPFTPRRGPNAPPAPVEPLRDRDVARMLGGPSGPSAPVPDAEVGGAERALVQAEVDLLACVLALPPLRERMAGQGLTDPRASQVWEAFAKVSQEAAVSMERLAQGAFSNLVGASAAAALLAEVVERARHIRDPETAFVAVEGRRRQFLARQEARRLRRDLEEARANGDQAKVDVLTRLFYQQLRQP